VRLTAEDGDQAHRSYSVASAPEDERLALTVERLPYGEFRHLVDELEPGDQLELPGPIGGYLVWEPALAGPVLLVPGGSDVVPLARDAAPPRRRPQPRRDAAPVLRAVASRPRLRQELSRLADVDPGVDVQLTFTRHWPANWNGHRGRIDRGLLGRIALDAAQRPLIYVCGPSGFVEAVANGLVDNGHLPEQPLESMARRVGHGGVTCPNWRVASSRPS